MLVYDKFLRRNYFIKKIFRYILLSFALMMLVACGKPDSQKAFEKGFKETMTDINKKMNEGGNEATKMIAKILEKATYKVNKVEENGNVSELDVTIKAVDLTKYLSEFMLSLKPMIETNMGEEAFTKATVDYFSDLSKKDLDYTETNIKVHMEKKGNELFLNPIHLTNSYLKLSNLLGLGEFSQGMSVEKFEKNSGLKINNILL